jgi:hypothetical protein
MELPNIANYAFPDQYMMRTTIIPIGLYSIVAECSV